MRITRKRQAPGLILISVLAAVVVVAVGILFWIQRDLPPSTGRDPGQAAAEQYVRDYVGHLDANDPARLARFLGKPEDSFEVRERLRRYGGQGLTDVRISMVHDFPNIYRVNIQARTASATTVRIDEVIGWVSDHWNMSPVGDAAPSPGPS